MTERHNPYRNLPSTAFWKTAVAEQPAHAIDLAWHPKSEITRDTKIITVGSCFAQHIGNSLRANGFCWLDSEPAPLHLAAEEHSKHGYGVFSFRIGNVYTAASLKQWIWWATGRSAPSTEYFFENGRYFDPFRPSLTEEGFASVEDMLNARRATLGSILDTIRQADLFIFTLGLTEAWRNQAGEVYPMCPGTIRGMFSSEHHAYHNYCVQEVEDDLTASFEALRSINPALRFLLTVSPVPLTATASSKHVLTATTYSKSVLRSAAGHLADMREDVDYFPSYELITTPPFKGRFYQDNLRSVTPEGVEFVMGQFFHAIDGGTHSPAEAKVAQATNVAGPHVALTAKQAGHDICDDIILESWASRPVDVSGAPANILLIGDSQMGMIAKLFDEQGIRYTGGAIMHGSEWHAMKFTSHDSEPFFTPTIPEAKARWLETYGKSLGAKAAPRDLWIITNIGLHARAIFSMEGIGGYIQRIRGAEVKNEARVAVTVDDFRNYIQEARPAHVRLLQSFVDAGYRVLWVGDPPADQRNAGYYDLIEEIISTQMKSVGCEVFSATTWLRTAFGGFPPLFASTEIDPITGQLDNIHGSPEYYRQLMREIFSRYSIRPQYTDPGHKPPL